MWSDSYRTPRYVWSTSAIAATALHAGLAWWGVSAWQNRHAEVTPAPIRVIALAEVPTAAAGSPSGGPAASATALPTLPAESAPVAATPNAPAETVPAAPAIAADPEPVEPLPPAPTAPWPQPSPANPAPIPPSPSPPPSPPVSSTSPSPPSPSPSQNRPFPSTVGELSPNPESGVRSSWSLVTVPGGTDLPEQLPRVPGGWAATTADVLSHAGCVSTAIAPGTSVQVTLWPDIEADGKISGFTPWSGPENQGRETLIRCIESLAPQLPPLEPAREGGSPIPSYAMLLVVDVATR